MNIRTKRTDKEQCPSDLAPGDTYRIFIPGIGPPVPQETVEEVNYSCSQLAFINSLLIAFLNL